MATQNGGQQSGAKGRSLGLFGDSRKGLQISESEPLDLQVCKLQLFGSSSNRNGSIAIHCLAIACCYANPEAFTPVELLTLLVC